MAAAQAEGQAPGGGGGREAAFDPTAVDDLPIDNVLNNSLGSNGPILCTQNPHNSLNIGLTQNLFSVATKNA